MHRSMILKSLVFLATGALVSCGPPAPQFSILPASEGAYQGSTANNKVDILFVIDNSGSMAPRQTALANSFSSFTSVFQSKGFDFHLAIITTDIRSAAAGGQAGEFQGTPSVIDTSTTNWASTFTGNITALGAGGNPNATALDAIELGLSTTLLNSTNTGFLRNKSHLAVVILSDDDDNDSTTTYTHVASFLTGLKPPQTDPTTGTSKPSFSVNSIVVDTSNSANTACAAPFGDGVKFKALSALTNGTVASVCEADYSAGLLNVSRGIAEVITQVFLARTPDSSTIGVTFNGVSVPNNSTNGWTYVSSTNKIVFHGSYIPSDGTSISISYTPSDIIR